MDKMTSLGKLSRVSLDLRSDHALNLSKFSEYASYASSRYCGCNWERKIYALLSLINYPVAIANVTHRTISNGCFRIYKKTFIGLIIDGIRGYKQLIKGDTSALNIVKNISWIAYKPLYIVCLTVRRQSRGICIALN